MERNNCKNHYKEIRRNGFRIWDKDHELTEDEFVEKSDKGQTVDMVRVSPPNKIEPKFRTHLFKNLHIGYSPDFLKKCKD